MLHRGPDGEGYYWDETICLGMRRLSIIDLEGGQQPISNEDGTIQLVCNGEIYNYHALKHDLQRHGHHFSTGSDVEVIVHLYEEYGEAALHHLRGMFALALWDVKNRKLLLARDRLGIKPLYYAQVGPRLYFASEIKALLASSEVPRRVNTAMLDGYLALQYVPGPQTLFEGIFKLLPGHYMVWQDEASKIERYWDLEFVTERRDMREADIYEAWQAHLQESVRLHLISDVPVGSLLSGGIDSSLVSALMAQETGGHCQTFTVGFEHTAFDERPFARRVATALGTVHHDIVTPTDTVQLLPHLIWLMEEPVADQAALPTYLICKFAAEHVKVVLTGEGGDEIGGGYPRYGWFRLAKRLQNILPTIRPDNRLLQWLAHHSRRERLAHQLQLMICNLPDRERHLRWVGNFTPEQRMSLRLDRERAQGAQSAVDQLVDGYLRQGDQTNIIHALMYLDTKTWLVDDVLTKVDKMSMGASLEVRVPLLDHRLLEFAATIPAALKIRYFGTKRLIRKAAATVLPPETVRRPKQAFRVPVGSWLRHGMREFMHDTLLSSRSLQRGYFAPDGVKTLVEEHDTSRHDHHQQLWNLLTLELWHQTFIDIPNT